MLSRPPIPPGARWLRLGALACALGLLGCPSATDDDDDVVITPFDCTIGLWHEDGTWQPADGAEAEMVLGIQSWLWVAIQLRADREGPDATNVRFSGTIDGEAPFGGSQPNVAFTTEGDARTSAEIQIRLLNEDGTGPYIDSALALDVRATSGQRECLATATVTLKDDDPCLHTGEEPLCDDDDSS